MSTSHPQRQAIFNTFGGPEEVRIVEATEPPLPGEGEVRVRVEASSVQFTDTLIRRGVYPDVRSKPPHTLGYDFVGRIDALGSNVQRWSVNDRVADLCVVGGNARWVVRRADGLTAVPESVDGAKATAMILSWMTAYQALHRVGQVGPGQRVLVTGANGAVGLALVQLAQLAGATVLASASERHHGLLTELGATPLPRDGWLSHIDGQVDVCIDGVCADGYRSPLAAVRRGGCFIPIGMGALAHAKGAQLQAAWHYLRARFLMNPWPDGKRVHFYNIAHTRVRRQDWWHTDLTHLLARLASDELAIRVAEELDFSDISEAHRRLERGGMVGKLVLRPWASLDDGSASS